MQAQLQEKKIGSYHITNVAIDFGQLPRSTRTVYFDAKSIYMMTYPTFRSVSYPGKVSPLLAQKRETVVANCLDGTCY